MSGRYCLRCERTAQDRICGTHGIPTVPGDFFEAGAGPISEGQVLGGRYRLGGVLGRGGNASVFRATQLGLGRDVAVKVVRAERIEDLQKLKRFYREVETILRLTHPGVVPVIDFGIDDESRSAYLVMEWIDGRTLRELVDEEGPLPIARWRDLFGQLARALSEAHQGGVVHRDLKPANILVKSLRDGSELLRVVDFGIAQLAEASPLTVPGTLLGSPHYMSPEQARREPTTAAADVYGFGCLAYFALTGDPPFTGESLAEIFNARLHGPTPELPGRLPDGSSPSSAIRRLLDACLAKDPEARPTMAAVVDVLRALDRGDEEPSEVQGEATQTFREVTLPADGPGAFEATGETDRSSSRDEPTETTVPTLDGVRTQAGAVPREILLETEAGPRPAIGREPPRREPRGREPRGRLYVAGALALVAGVALGVVALGKREARPSVPAEVEPSTVVGATGTKAREAVRMARIRSTPAGADVVSGGSSLGVTPLSVPLDRVTGQLRIQLDGYESKSFQASDLGAGELDVELVKKEARRVTKSPARRPVKERSESYPVW
ncbi:MAG: serine/threonine protein kinase [Deltaproteobacteria bacterium]|nr:serine/threonine protein kinase [Deltaproteobacteria bacterium]